MPSNAVLNSFGWIDCPTTQDLYLPLCAIKPDEERTIYWIYENIVANSSKPIRFTLEGNFTWDESLNDFDPNGWLATTGYMVSSTKDHQLVTGNFPIRTKAGEALRLRVHSDASANEDFTFKWIGIDLPWKDTAIHS